jgi:hypothetical protein
MQMRQGLSALSAFFKTIIGGETGITIKFYALAIKGNNFSFP